MAAVQEEDAHALRFDGIDLRERIGAAPQPRGGWESNSGPLTYQHPYCGLPCHGVLIYLRPLSTSEEAMAGHPSCLRICLSRSFAASLPRSRDVAATSGSLGPRRPRAAMRRRGLLADRISMCVPV